MVVNREEIKILQSKFNNAFQKGIGTTILVSGEDGIGKSFFVNDFIRKISQENKYNPKLKVFSATSYCDGRYTNLYPWKELFIDLESNIASLNVSDDPSLKSEIDYKKIVRNVYEGHGADWLKLIPVVGNYASELLKIFKSVKNETKAQEAAQNIMMPNLNISLTKNEDVFIQLMSKFRKLTENHILVLFIRDIQFFDMASLDLFYALSKNLKENPYRLILIGSLCQEELMNKKIDPITGKIDTHPVDTVKLNLEEIKSFEEIILSRFDTNQIKEFFKLRFPQNEFTSEFIKEIEKTTNGNAYFLEEVTKNLKENGCIFEDKGIFKNKLSSDYFIVPSSIGEIIKIRYECLHDELKIVLDIASVMGDDFSAEIISDIQSEDLTKFLMKIRKLRENYEIIENANKNYIKLTRIYKYVHNLFQKFVYNNLIEDELNIDYHCKVAETLKKFFEGDKINYVLEQFNFHLGIGNRIMNEKGSVILEKENSEDNDLKSKVEEYLDSSKKLISGYEKTFSNIEAIKRCNIVIEISRIMENKDLEFEYSLKRGDILKLIGEWNEAESQYKSILKFSEELNDKTKIANITICLGNLLQNKGDYEEALVNLNRSLKIFEELKDKSGIARNLISIGNIFKLKGNYDEALAKYEEALKIREELGEKNGLGAVMICLGNIYYDKSNYKQAEIYYRRALNIYEELNIKQDIPDIIKNIGNIHFAKAEFQEANSLYKQALNGYEGIGNKKGIADILINIGVINYNIGNFEESLKNYNEALKINETLGDKKGMAICYRNSGLVFYNKKDYDKAMEYYLNAKTLNEQLENKIEIALCQFDIGEIYIERNNNETAFEFFNKAISICRELNVSYNLCSFLYRIAVAQFKLGRIKESFDINNEAMEIAKKIERKVIVFNSQILSAKLMALSDKVKSKTILEEMLQNVKEETQIAEINYELYKLYGEDDARKKSLETYSKLFDLSANVDYKNKIDELKQIK